MSHTAEGVGRATATSAIFRFPEQVNEVAARSVAAGVVVTVVVAIATRSAWLALPLAYGFVARVLSGPRFSPLAQLATRVVAPRLPRHERLVPGAPKRFAQGIGAAFTLAASGLDISGERGAALVVLGVLAIPALLEAAAGLCLGCTAFGWLGRAGWIPATACAECADIRGPAAALARARSSMAGTSATGR